MELLVDGEKEKFRAGLLKALGELGIAQERIVTLENALRAVEWVHEQCPTCKRSQFDLRAVQQPHFPDCQLDLANTSA